MKVRIGTRASKLARIQSAQIGSQLEQAGHVVETIVIRTAGDRSRKPFAAIGAPGVFVREIEAALLAGRIDLAVHSYKDLPAQGTAGLVVASVPKRLDPADLLLTRRQDALRSGLLQLPAAARVGTAAKRREVWLHHWRPDLKVLLLRGNLNTRLRRLEHGDFDAIVIAAAGLDRLQSLESGVAPPFQVMTRIRLDPEVFVPAPAQGALALQIREHDRSTRALVAGFNHPESERQVRAERALLRRVDGGCNLPFGAWCRSVAGGGLEMIAMLGSGDSVLRARGQGREAEALAEKLWRQLCETPGDQR
ncbi:MAG TPA: hydroxymethylbilane synthase [Acidobacteriota bacterium]